MLLKQDNLTIRNAEPEDRRKACRDYWYAYIYEQQVVQEDEVAFLLETVGKTPQRILEVACGGGRILARLAAAGHAVSGFDADDAMLAHCRVKIRPFDSAACYRADALQEDWGGAYDVVVLAGNILLNLVTDMDYKDAQALLIRKAAEALRPGGHLYLDLDCFDRPVEDPDNKREWVCFEGTDDRGTFGKYIVASGEYDPVTRMDRSSRRYEITPVGSSTIMSRVPSVKHFPRLRQVHDWLCEAGLEIEQEFGGYDRRPVDETAWGNRAVIWAKKR
jgi:SAM-dependent methyltransferase